MSKPKVSVIIPVYNSAKHIDRAIISAFSQNVSLEVIVVNDNSNDNLELIVAKYSGIENFIYIKLDSNVGAAEARNLGVAEAKGEYVAFLDADDMWKNSKLIEQLNLIAEKNTYMCYTGREIADKDGISTAKIINVRESVNYRQLLQHNCIVCSSVLVKREIALEFPMKYSQYHEDYFTWLSIIKKYGTIYGVNKPLLLYCLSENGKSRNKLKSAYMTFKVYRVKGYNVLQSIFYMFSHIIHSFLKYYILTN